MPDAEREPIGPSGPAGNDEPRIEVYPDPDATAHAAAARISAALIDAAKRRGRADWATTGGSSPIGIYDALGELPLRGPVPWPAVQVWWGDDRFVPRADPLSNVRALDLALDRGPLAGVGLPAANLHVIPMDAAIGLEHDPAWAATTYERELREAPIPLAPNGFPSLDLVLLGIGPDGHILSVFPGAPAFPPDAWVAGIPAPTHIEPHVPRVSLNPGFVAAARLVILVATGSGKAAMIREVLGPERDTDRWPAQHARRSNAVWLLDTDAATKIGR